MYHECIIVVLHNANTHPPMYHKYAVIRQQYMYELSHELCRYISDTRTIRPILVAWRQVVRVCVLGGGIGGAGPGPLPGYSSFSPLA